MSQSISNNFNCPDVNLSVGVEASLAPLGCIYDTDGETLLGKVFLCKIVEDEVDSTPAFEIVAYYLDGTVERPYTGTWENCDKQFENLVPIKIEEMCSIPSEIMTNQEFVGSAADGANGHVSTGWQDSLSGQIINLISPSPTGGDTSWTNGDITVEQVDYVIPQTPLASLIRRNIVIENPVNQGGAFAAGAGFDNTTGSSSNINAFLISFNTPKGAFGAIFLDTESDINFEEACYELYDSSENLLATVPITYPSGENGGGEAHFVGWTRSVNDVSYMLIKTGATAAMPNNLTNRLAFGDVRIVELQEIPYSVVTVIDTISSEISCIVYDENKEVVDIDPSTLIKCGTNEIIAVESKCDTYTGVTIDDTVWIQEPCDISGTIQKWVHPTDDIAIIDEQTLVGGWAYVINSNIDPINCSVEAASIIPGSPPDPTTLESIDYFIEIQEIKERTPTGVLLYKYVIEDDSGNLVNYVPLGEVGNCQVVSYAPIQLPETCVNINGTPSYAFPVVWGNTSTKELDIPVYLDRMGNVITDIVTVANECDCDCPECP